MEIVQNKANENIKRNEIEQVEQEKQEYKLLGKFLRTRGLMLFCYNSETGELSKANVVERKIVKTKILDGKLEVMDQSIQEVAAIDPGKIVYFEALNVKTAVKRLLNYQMGKVKRLNNLKPAGKLSIWYNQNF